MRSSIAPQVRGVRWCLLVIGEQLTLLVLDLPGEPGRGTRAGDAEGAEDLARPWQISVSRRSWK